MDKRVERLTSEAEHWLSSNSGGGFPIFVLLYFLDFSTITHIIFLIKIGHFIFKIQTTLIQGKQMKF